MLKTLQNQINNLTYKFLILKKATLLCYILSKSDFQSGKNHIIWTSITMKPVSR